MNRKLILLLGIMAMFLFCISQSKGQVIKGRIIDSQSQAPLPGATVVILESDPQLGTITNENGEFRLWNVKPGRYNLMVSFVGYENYLFREVLVGTGKEVVLNAGLSELQTKLDEVKIVARTSKEQPINRMASINARQLSVEEASRYAGGFDDPARLAGSFAGVASEIGNNGIVIRGNSPRNLLWRMEGIEISNPTHFANVIAFGAGGITALSSHMLANSDFYTGAFPAEYGNALSGVFDVRLRNGNKDKHEHTFQAGIIGIDFSSEGPFQKEGGASYLFNYRYSTYTLLGGLIPEEAGDIGYQDLSFKLNFPTKNLGNFSLWGIGAIDDQERDPLKDPEDWETVQDIEGYELDLKNGAIGLSHKILFNTKTYLHTTLAFSGNSINTKYDELDGNQELQVRERVKNNTWKYTLSSNLNHKFGSTHSNRTGLVLNQHNYNVFNREAPNLGDPLFVYVNEEGDAFSAQAFTQSSIKLNTVNLNLGLHMHYFGLNDEVTIEPRVGLKWLINPYHSFGAAYGLNSRIEMIGFYLARQQVGNEIIQPNKDMKMTKSHHFGVEYSIQLNENTRFKIEPYYQYMFDVPVIKDSYFSLQNLDLDWFFNEALVNDGTGTNIGIDFTLERFLTKGFYYLATASFFDSNYEGGDGVSRNSMFDRNYIVNFLAGKEWQVGNDKMNTLGVNGRFSFMGGDRYSPLLEQESIAAEELVYDYSRAFEEQEDPAAVLSLSFSYRKNKPKHATVWSLHLLNVLGNEEYRDYEFNLKTGKPEKQFDRIMVPNLSYKIEF